MLRPEPEIRKFATTIEDAETKEHRLIVWFAPEIQASTISVVGGWSPNEDIVEVNLKNGTEQSLKPHQTVNTSWEHQEGKYYKKP